MIRCVLMSALSRREGVPKISALVGSAKLPQQTTYKEVSSSARRSNRWLVADRRYLT